MTKEEVLEQLEERLELTDEKDLRIEVLQTLKEIPTSENFWYLLKDNKIIGAYEYFEDMEEEKLKPLKARGEITPEHYTVVQGSNARFYRSGIAPSVSP